MSIIWENTDGCDEQYRCVSALHLMSVISQSYSVIIDQVISAPGHDKEVVYELNAVDKHYIYQFMSNVKLPGSNRFDSQMQMHTGNQKLWCKFISAISTPSNKRALQSGVFDQGKTINYSWKENGQTDSIMFRIMLMFHTNMWECIVTQINPQHYHFVVHIPNLMVQGGWSSTITCILI